MRALFVDTAGWVACADEADPAYYRAIAVRDGWLEAGGVFVTTRDKDFSFTDCTSFVVMRELRLREVLTTDHHFAQAGFSVKP